MDEISLEDVIEILQDVEEDVDYENCTTLIDDRVLDSFDILSIISALRFSLQHRLNFRRLCFCCIPR
ncbi:MAG: hypothetical protein IJ092_08675 [Atopobiaceae bacterium]|nr:hypothetical protein [Atopobiaceae bacterium]